MTVATIQIDGNSYTSYSSVADADVRLSVDIVRRATWNAATADDKARSLVAATDRLDAFQYIGEKTSSAQPREWPRSGVSGVADTDVPDAIKVACQLLAGDLLIDPNAGRPTNPTAQIGSLSKLKVGSIELDYYTGQRVVLDNTAANVLGAEIHPLIEPYLLVRAGTSAGVSVASSADIAGSGYCFPPLDYSRSWPV